MSLNVTFDPETNVVESVLSGIINPAELREETVQAAALAEENDCTLFLSDFSQATVEFSIFDVYNLPRLQQEQGLKQSIRVAVLAPTSELGRQLAHFYELVSLNRGWKTSLFQDRQEALDWLLE